MDNEQSFNTNSVVEFEDVTINQNSDNQMYYTRFSDIVSQKILNTYAYHIVGTGAIGSHIALALSKMGAKNIRCWDFDTVSVENIGVQGFPTHAIGKPKVQAMGELIAFYNPSAAENYIGYNTEFKLSEFRDDESYPSIFFIAVDSMSTRAKISKLLKKEHRVVLTIDGRMASEMLVVLAYTNDRYDSYATTLFDDDDRDAIQEPCTHKSTLYTAMLAAGFMVARVRLWLFRHTPVSGWYSSMKWDLKTDMISRPKF